MRWKETDIITVDTHADSLGAVLSGQRHLTETSTKGQLDFPRMRQVGHRVQFFSCWVEPEYKPDRALTRTLAYIDAFWEEVRHAADLVMPVNDRASLDAALASGKIAALLSIEGADAVTGPGHIVRLLYRLGVRLMSLTWNQRNLLADGAGEDPGGGGLSQAGRQVVHQMNEIGMIVDVSHLAEAGFWDVLAVSQKPVIASHSNCRALKDHRRNLSDAQIRALAEKGGIQGITFVRDFLGGTADLDRVVDHIVHALDVVGDDRHTGIGSDFDGVEEPVPGLEDVTGWPRLAERLADRQLSDDTIRRVLGENYINFLYDIWA
ncbi:Membrane dipeptidase [Sulfobacillus acidophilus TPY]|uniref:Dipeptidase n=1 Tax=Sulfobacillus acidophilus (strain ATCC 700253 / DSM 10332 / NAL) TaxID=679936 RepID=G8U0P2_SULAD|nr:Membrane dipeptidase [Sulfobacillus acidophilus TPY]AEW05345.1 dipeptidase [Sulfobacillus acidophilus DSM 10332]